MNRSFTGRVRRRKTAPAVRVVDRIARVLITFGGIGTIIAVTLVCVYLVSVVVPLFTGSSAEERRELAAVVSTEAPLAIGGDEYGLLRWSVSPSGELVVKQETTGEVLLTRYLQEEGRPTAVRVALGGHFAVGTADGAVRVGRIDFAPRFLVGDAVPRELADLRDGEVRRHGAGVAQRIRGNAIRTQEPRIEIGEPMALGGSAPVLLVDASAQPNGSAVAAFSEDGVLRYRRFTERRNLMTGDVRVTSRGGDVAIEPRADGVRPDHVLVSGRGDTVYLVWADGETRRFDTREPARPVLAEVVDLAPEAGARLTAIAFLIGRQSLITGDDSGRIRAWFRTKAEGVDTVDGSVLENSHTLRGAAAVTALSASTRDRKALAGFADGRVSLLHVTTDRVLDTVVAASGEPVVAVAYCPKDDRLFAATTQRLVAWEVDAPHPESTLGAIFRPVWYEGYEAPAHVWQSSSGTDDFEPKYGLVPLVFGSLKATLYSMLFAVPIALLAAIYTSEFLKPSVKARVKPSIELMASLPSVVLGFLAALVIAPFVEHVVPAVLATFVTAPFFLLLSSYLWNLLPERRAMALSSFRLPMSFAVLPLALWAATAIGPWLEDVFFWVETPTGRSGDLRVWLSGAPGASGVGGWLFASLPLSALFVGWISARHVTPRLRRAAGEWSRAVLGWVDLAKFLLASVATIGVALAAAAIFDAVMFDPREAFLGTYVQRNALVVGFVMGFAIIPIIYTIAEDALSAVPEQLRAASLGAGATPWQTAIRIVVPTAMSGLFSAVMIGFGRAVGETMIVLMAAGNTPVMDWNVFNGFRTLSANIAVELPEAPVHSTHYRMLFLAALVLFAMTFALNTIAEFVRQRFRKRAYQL